MQSRREERDRYGAHAVCVPPSFHVLVRLWKTFLLAVELIGILKRVKSSATHVLVCLGY